MSIIFNEPKPEIVGIHSDITPPTVHDFPFIGLYIYYTTEIRNVKRKIKIILKMGRPY